MQRSKALTPFTINGTQKPFQEQANNSKCLTSRCLETERSTSLDEKVSRRRFLSLSDTLTASHPYGEFTHPKKVICTGEKLGLLTLNYAIRVAENSTQIIR